MKKTSIIALLAAALLVAGIITAGCTQDAGSGSGSSGNSQQYSPPSTGNSPPAGNDGSPSGGSAPGQQYSPPGTGNGPPSGTGGYGGGYSGNRQFSGQSFLTNQTLLTTAAGELGVSETDLQNALSTTTNATTGRPNLAAAAQQLGVTQQQLMDAFGFPAGGFRGGRYNSTTPPGIWIIIPARGDTRVRFFSFYSDPKHVTFRSGSSSHSGHTSPAAQLVRMGRRMHHRFYRLKSIMRRGIIMSTNFPRTGIAILGTILLLAVIAAGCTSSPYAPARRRQR